MEVEDEGPSPLVGVISQVDLSVGSDSIGNTPNSGSARNRRGLENQNRPHRL